MCQTYNSIGSLEDVKTHLSDNGITQFKSLNELIDFRNNYEKQANSMLQTCRIQLIEEEKQLTIDIEKLSSSVKSQSNVFQQKIAIQKTELNYKRLALQQQRFSLFSIIQYKIKQIMLHFQMNVLKNQFDSQLNALQQTLEKKRSRLRFIQNNFDDALKKIAAVELRELKRTKSVSDEIVTSIYGAIGEQKVEKELKKLSDDYYLINNFTQQFDPPIYYKKEQRHIYSIQIDHLLISPHGIFVIETKNWSKESVDKQLLKSPIEQVITYNFALYNLLKQEMKENSSFFFKNNWGDKKIPIKNLIVMTNHSIPGEFEYVKLLNLEQLNSYINYFNPNFTMAETKKIAQFFLKLNAN